MDCGILAAIFSGAFIITLAGNLAAKKENFMSGLIDRAIEGQGFYLRVAAYLFFNIMVIGIAVLVLYLIAPFAMMIFIVEALTIPGLAAALSGIILADFLSAAAI